MGRIKEAAAKTQASAPVPQAPQATVTPLTRNGRRAPAFVVKAKQHPQSPNFMEIGVAFPFKSGEPGYVLKVHALPLNFDGLLALFPFDTGQVDADGVVTEAPPL